MGRRTVSLWLDFKKNGGLPLLFLLLLFLPLGDMIFHVSPPLAIKENRRPASMPEFSWKTPWKFLKGYEAYFNDHFGFRPLMVRTHNDIVYTVFHTSPSEKVVIGRQGWLFLGRGTRLNNEVDYYRALRPFSRRELEAFTAVLEQRRVWLARRGIQYLFVLAPNKSTIYPEYMPAAINKVHPLSRMDQLLAHLASHSRVRVLDLRPVLLQEKRKARIYHKTDSHWNDLGGYFAYREMIRFMQPYFPDLRPAPLERFTISRVTTPGGDLAIMLSLQRDRLRETRITVKPKAPRLARMGASTPGFRPKARWVRLHAVECPAGQVPAALMVRDSFAQQLHPFLSEHFQRIVYIWDWGLHFFIPVIEKERPAIVIDQMAERSLLDPIPVNPAALALGNESPGGGRRLSPR